jgi:outer membrane protein assembly factor BamB
LLRMDGIWGGQQADIHWRWTPTAEQLFLAERANRQVAPPDRAASRELVSRPSDWPGYRGFARDGAVTGVKIETDWDQNPPKQLWKQRVGPAWSSMAVVGDRLFTQEQRGRAEAVVCLDANTGHEVWSHEDTVRFEESVSGAGPRATPAFAGGRIYAQGATGILNCLDANTGERKWSTNIAEDAGAKLPQWGFTASPLVVGQLVIAYAGGKKGLLAYDVDTGKPAWDVSTGTQAYTSPQLATICGEEQILLFDDKGLVAVNPVSGNVLWAHDETVTGAPRSIQPHAVGKSQVLISSEADLGTALIDVTHDGKAWATKRGWVSRDLKPSFNDYVVHDGFIYGFDGAGFCCVDLAAGKKRWRERAYGYGQVLLLADQGVLLVISEEGEAVLVAASPGKHEELGRFKAIEGKTWNHPALANGRLYVRNAQEIACYQLQLAE